MTWIYQIKQYKSRSICPENSTGEKGHAAMSVPEAGSPAEKLGEGWKARPYIWAAPRDTAVLADIQTEGMITGIWMAGEIDQGLVLKIYWDDSEYPSVECPVPEFFLYGFIGPQNSKEGYWNRGPKYHVDSLLMAVNPNRGFNCYIPMPFRKHARILLENRTTNKKAVYYQINYEERPVEQDAGYFHAQMRVSMPVKYRETHTVLDGVKGSGMYIGTALYVGLNRAARWWGEGEVKFYLDGDREYPTICSTGLEDYFGGAYNWDTESEYTTYSNLYTGLPHVERPDGLYQIQQRFSLYRWHVCDPVRFQKDIRVTMQDLGWIKDDDGNASRFLQREDDFISVAYWYLDHPGDKFPKLISHEDLTERF
ncbi:MAG TPA: DUF2961 domain-containing protein [Candidatus Mediterraneibacter merdipullorum]|nr:DUF2961 domain-containing protein [Candidatus Mediterraneibacter merdipullorum]